MTSPVASRSQPLNLASETSSSLMKKVLDVVAMIYRTFNDLGLSEREKIDTLKNQLASHRKINAQMSREQGTLAFKAGLIGLTIFAAGYGCSTEKDQKFVHALAERGVPAVESYFRGEKDARQRVASELASFLMTEYSDKVNNASNVSSGPKQDAKALLDAAGQSLLAATR